jgi:hypothetical protein
MGDQATDAANAADGLAMLSGDAALQKRFELAVRLARRFYAALNGTEDEQTAAEEQEVQATEMKAAASALDSAVLAASGTPRSSLGSRKSSTGVSARAAYQDAQKRALGIAIDEFDRSSDFRISNVISNLRAEKKSLVSVLKASRGTGGRAKADIEGMLDDQDTLPVIVVDAYKFGRALLALVASSSKKPLTWEVVDLLSKLPPDAGLPAVSSGSSASKKKETTKLAPDIANLLQSLDWAACDALVAAASSSDSSVAAITDISGEAHVVLEDDADEVEVVAVVGKSSGAESVVPGRAAGVKRGRPPAPSKESRKLKASAAAASASSRKTPRLPQVLAARLLEADNEGAISDVIVNFSSGLVAALGQLSGESLSTAAVGSASGASLPSGISPTAGAAAGDSASLDVWVMGRARPDATHVYFIAPALQFAEELLSAVEAAPAPLTWTSVLAVAARSYGGIPPRMYVHDPRAAGAAAAADAGAGALKTSEGVSRGGRPRSPNARRLLICNQ